MSENNNMENTADQGQEEREEKVFTQEDVNRIVSSRLARAKSESSAQDFEDREAALNRKELFLDAREKFEEADLPKELLDIINLKDKETLDKDIKMLQKILIEYDSKRPRYKITPQPGWTENPSKTRRVSTGTSNSGPSSQGGSDATRIRKAMGLRG